MKGVKVVTATETRVEPALLTIEEACAFLRLGRTKILSCAYDGSLPSVKIGTARRFPVEGLRAWIEQNTEKQTDARESR
jgi:excisionase family DNA binding protein